MGSLGGRGEGGIKEDYVEIFLNVPTLLHEDLIRTSG